MVSTDCVGSSLFLPTIKLASSGWLWGLFCWDDLRAELSILVLSLYQRISGGGEPAKRSQVILSVNQFKFSKLHNQYLDKS